MPYARPFDTFNYPHGISWWHLVNSSKLSGNYLNLDNWNEVESSLLTKIDTISQSKCHQNVQCGQSNV